jgi:hypothetical protein
VNRKGRLNDLLAFAALASTYHLHPKTACLFVYKLRDITGSRTVPSAATQTCDEI